jgi:hypothetical protein
MHESLALRGIPVQKILEKSKNMKIRAVALYSTVATVVQARKLFESLIKEYCSLRSQHDAEHNIGHIAKRIAVCIAH